jgi:hypothetical protein
VTLLSRKKSEIIKGKGVKEKGDATRICFQPSRKRCRAGKGAGNRYLSEALKEAFSSEPFPAATPTPVSHSAPNPRQGVESAVLAEGAVLAVPAKMGGAGAAPSTRIRLATAPTTPRPSISTTP